MFWEDANNDYKQPPEPQREDRYCPVCPKTFLGHQYKGMEVSLHCDDCRAWYTWFPGVDKPISKLDCNVPKQCNCFSCRQRRED